MRCSRVSRWRRGSGNPWSAGSISTSLACATSPRQSSHCQPQPMVSPPPHWPPGLARANQSPSAYGPRQAAYDLKKLRGKQIVQRIGSTRRYEPVPSGLRAITALLVLRDKAIKPLLAAAQEITPTHGGQNPRTIDRHDHDLRLAMHGVFHELGIAA